MPLKMFLAFGSRQLVLKLDGGKGKGDGTVPEVDRLGCHSCRQAAWGGTAAHPTAAQTDPPQGLAPHTHTPGCPLRHTWAEVLVLWLSVSDPTAGIQVMVNHTAAFCTAAYCAASCCVSGFTSGLCIAC